MTNRMPTGTRLQIVSTIVAFVAIAWISSPVRAQISARRDEHERSRSDPLRGDSFGHHRRD